MAMMLIWFGFGQVTNMLQSTGAFEIHVNGNLVYSKLQTGAMPNEADLRQAFGPYDIAF